MMAARELAEESVIEPLLDTCETEVHSELPLFTEVLKAKLPVYIVNCFLISGFDTHEVVALMDVSNNPGNSIEQIEEFITENKLYQDAKYVDELIYQEKFSFPPGHRLRIVQFVHKQREEIASARAMQKKAYRRRSSFSPMKKLDMDTVSGNLQRQLTAWARKQEDNEDLRLLEEHKHYVINVMELGDSEETKRLKATILCLLCNKAVLLYGKDRSFMLSNYTKHIKGCIRKNQAMVGGVTILQHHEGSGEQSMIVQLPQIVTCGTIVEGADSPQ